MGINDDFVDPLVTDILTEVAGNFFEARRLLDRKIDLFHANVELLKHAADKVEARAAFLNYLLIGKKEASVFYESLPVPSEPFLVGESLSRLALPFRLPSALTSKRKYFKLIFWAFKELRLECDTYINGEKHDAATHPRVEEPVGAYFNLVNKMHILINEEIQKINCYMSPSCTLQFARSFDLETSDKEKTFGRTSPDLSSLDEKMRYESINFDSLNIKSFPALPSGTGVTHTIKKSVNRIYRNRRSLVMERIAALKLQGSTETRS